MIDQKDRLTFPASRGTGQPQDPFQIAIVLIVAATITVAFYLYLALTTNIWQLYGATAAASITLTAGIWGAWLSRRHSPVRATWVIILGIGFAFLTFAIFIENFGLLLGIVTVILASMIASYSLNATHTTWAVISSVGLGFVMFLLDLLPLTYRASVPQFEIYVPVVVGLMLLVYGYYMIQQFSNYSIRTKLILTYLGVVVIPLTALSYFNSLSVRSILIEEANDKLLGAASQTATSIDSFISGNLSGIGAVAQFPDLVNFLSQADSSLQGSQVTKTLLSLSSQDIDYIDSYALLNVQGVNVADSVGTNIGADEAPQGYFTEPLETGQLYVSPVEFPENSEEPVIHFSAPIRDALGTIIGVVRLRYRAAVLQELIETSVAGEDSFAVLFDENHLHLAHSKPDIAATVNYTLLTLPDAPQLAALRAAKRVPNRPDAEIVIGLPDLEASLHNPDTTFFEAIDVATGDQINQAAVTGLAERPWVVAFFQPQNSLFAPVEKNTNNTILLTVVIGIMAALVAMFISQKLTTPMINLTHVAQMVAEGDLKIKATIETQDEIGQLAQAFNHMTNQLQGLVGSLEDQVADRTKDLSLSITVGQQAGAIRDLDVLLPTIVNLIQDQFSLYHVQVYLINDTRQSLVLISGTGEAGQAMLARQHSLPLNETSIVGKTAVTGVSVLIPDVEVSTVHKYNPLLPETRSELALPLLVEGKITGVLDLQAVEANTFTPENSSVFEAMATQLAISIDSAQQWTAAQAAQQRLETLIGQLTREAWAEKLQKSQALRFAYDLQKIIPIEAEAENQNGSLSVPVVVQNETIGRLAVKPPPERPLSVDEQSLVATVAQQLAQKAENLRLFEATQQQASREQVARQIADKIRSSRDVESALKIAAEELTKALGTARAVVDLQVTNLED